MPFCCWSETVPTTVNRAGPEAVESSMRCSTRVFVAEAMLVDEDHAGLVACVGGGQKPA